MLSSILRKLSSVFVFLLFATSALADNVLVIHQNYAGPGVIARLEAAGHTVTGSTSEVYDLSAYDQVWDTRYNSMSGSAVTAYNSFVQGGGFLYLTTENPGCCQGRNNQVAALISAMGGGAGLTIGGSAGYASNNVNTVNTTYMTDLNGASLTFAAVSAIANYGDGQWLMKDYAGKVVSVMWVGNAGNLAEGYTGTVITVADINWIDGSRLTGNNITALDDIISGIVAGTVEGTISAEGTGSGSAPAAPTPVYSSSITAEQASRRAANQSINIEAHINIEGNSNLVTVEQIGDAHYLELGIVGGSNTVDIEQSTVTGGAHYLEASIQGSSNTLDITQSGTGKSAFVTIDGNSNVATITQQDTGQHYLQLDMIGDGHDATIVQEGSGNHAATVELTNGGGAWDFDLTQSGATNKEYSLPHDMSDGTTTSGTCYVAAGCSLSITQAD